MFHDVYYTRFTRLDNGQVESWDLYVTLLDWHFKLRRQHPRHARLQPDLRAALRAVRDLARRACCRRASTASRASGAICLSTATKRRLSGSVNVTCGNYWSGQGRAGDDQPHLQGCRRGSPSASAPTRRSRGCRRATSPRGSSPRNVNYTASPRLSFSNLDPVRQPVAESGLAEPRALDAAARQRFFFVFNQGWIQEDEATTCASGRRTARCPRSSSTRSVSEQAVDQFGASTGSRVRPSHRLKIEAASTSGRYVSAAAHVPELSLRGATMTPWRRNHSAGRNVRSSRRLGRTCACHPCRDLARKPSPLGERRIASPFDLRRKEVPVVTVDFLQPRYESGRIQVEPMERDDGDGVAQELEILETTAVVTCGRASMVDPDVLRGRFRAPPAPAVPRLLAASAHSLKSSEWSAHKE